MKWAVLKEDGVNVLQNFSFGFATRVNLTMKFFINFTD